MSECVVRMEMPKACWFCGLRFVCKAANDFMTTKEAGCSVLKVGMEGCLIVCKLPEGHGRLVDADKLFEQMENTGWWNNLDRDDIAEELLISAPTIVPADTAGRSET